MKTQTLIFDTKTNVGVVDRYVRFSAATGLIAVPLLYDGIDAEFAALTALIAIPIMFTAIVRWCPLYAFLHVQSIKHKYDNARFYGKNVSTADAVTRYVVGATLILATMLLTSIADPWVVTLALIAVPVISSAIIQWDPLYALFEVGSHNAAATYAGHGAEVVVLHGNNKPDTQPTRPCGGRAKAA